MDTDPLAPLPAELQQQMTRHGAPEHLRTRIRIALEQEARASAPAPAPAPPQRSPFWWRWMPLGASFACGALLAVTLMGYRDNLHGQEQADAHMEQQVVAGHLRSLLAQHLTDVASSDHHTVKPWFTGKLDYAPPVIDLADQGFPLAGGRLDLLADHPVAALVYHHGGHTINVFVMPAPAGMSAGEPRVAEQQGFHIMGWTRQDMRFWAVTDMDQGELATFVAKMQAAP